MNEIITFANPKTPNGSLLPIIETTATFDWLMTASPDVTFICKVYVRSGSGDPSS